MRAATLVRDSTARNTAVRLGGAADFPRQSVAGDSVRMTSTRQNASGQRSRLDFKAELYNEALQLMATRREDSKKEAPTQSIAQARQALRGLLSSALQVG
jgi:hypothetical protein